MFKFLMMVLMSQSGHAGFMDGGGDGSGNSGGNNSSDDGSDDANVSDKDIEPDANGIEYPTDLDKEYHGNETLLKHYDSEKKSFRTGNMMKSLIHATSNIGRDKMLVPHKDFTPDQWKDTYGKLGLPTDIGDYKLENTVKEGLMVDETQFEGFKKAAHDAGVLPSQAQKILEFYNSSMATQSEANQGIAQKALEDQVSELKKDWGDDFTRNLGVADASIQKFATAEEIAYLSKKGILADPTLTKIFNNIGKSISEDSFQEGIKDSFGKTKGEIQSEIDSYYEQSHPFRNPTHPQYNYYKDKMMKMLQSIHGTK